jgi:hypothetical protein
MTVQQVQQAAAALEQQITALVQAFEAQTLTLVHSLPVRAGDGKTPTTVEVKVQIP